jgi:hypothetical protein
MSSNLNFPYSCSNCGNNKEKEKEQEKTINFTSCFACDVKIICFKHGINGQFCPCCDMVFCDKCVLGFACVICRKREECSSCGFSERTDSNLLYNSDPDCYYYSDSDSDCDDYQYRGS